MTFLNKLFPLFNKQKIIFFSIYGKMTNKALASLFFSILYFNCTKV